MQSLVLAYNAKFRSTLLSKFARNLAYNVCPYSVLFAVDKLVVIIEIGNNEERKENRNEDKIF